MWNWVRHIYTPEYGKCGGKNRDCSISKPRDWLDLAFKDHDDDLHKAVTKYDRDVADKRLGRKLRKGNPKKLSLYGRAYLFVSKMVFKP